jgi:hypothetical protein
LSCKSFFTDCGSGIAMDRAPFDVPGGWERLYSFD